MAVEKKFIKKALKDLKVKIFLNAELERAGVSEVVIQKTPIATRISIFVRRPGIVVGKKGKGIRDLCEDLQTQFGIENPQIEVVEVAKPELDAKLVAEKIGSQIELNPRIKPIMRFALREVMSAGALGCEIRVAGKVQGKGAKAKTLAIRAGYLKKSGNVMHLVKEGRYVAYLKAGAIGVSVKIVAPGTVFPDQVSLANLTFTPSPTAPEAVQEAKELEAAKQVTDEKPKAVEKKPRKPRVKKQAETKETTQPSQQPNSSAQPSKTPLASATSNPQPTLQPAQQPTSQPTPQSTSQSTPQPVQSASSVPVAQETKNE